MSNFKSPCKAIHSNNDFEQFKKSIAYHDITDFIKLCAESVVDTMNSSNDQIDDTITSHSEESLLYNQDNSTISNTVVIVFVGFMNRLFHLILDIPPIKQPMRFGNKAFKQWHAAMLIEAKIFLHEILSHKFIDDNIDNNIHNLETCKDELIGYISDMFGNCTRIDYGTGHELNFAIFFLLLLKLKLIQQTDLKLIILKCFTSYIKVMRKLQIDYMLEPAGSHGVWGLDDYHCLLFLWGAAQLSAQKNFKRLHEIDITPQSIHDQSILNEYADEFIYLEGIQFIKRIKACAPFAETSPMLNDISTLHDWGKICSGLMRVFQGEVMNKFPVIQHLLFGSLLQCTWNTPQSNQQSNITHSESINTNNQSITNSQSEYINSDTKIH